ncbi:hypothetical protein F2Q69_00053338 [Brassica cretica]|uniref:Uncharacterized protein n=1 Tax=Brassica cretica TaxID=69181 RepID=A0A8S9MT58_BRACR|nr:hypothetical protein F2Q69_00053338 [Brassica cretica]
MTNDSNTPIDTTNVTTTPLNVAATDATVTTAGNITASTAAATTSTILPAGNAADETTRRSLFGAGLYQTGRERIPHAPAAAVRPARLGCGRGRGRGKQHPKRVTALPEKTEKEFLCLRLALEYQTKGMQCKRKTVLGQEPKASELQRNMKVIAQLRGSEELWEVAKLHNRESSFPESHRASGKGCECGDWIGS